MTLRQWLADAYAEFKSAGIDQPRAEAEMLVGALLLWPRAKLVTHDAHELDDEQRSHLDLGLLRRISGEPLAYICGYKDFFKSRFEVGPGALIPRPETELVVEAALELLALGDTRIADFGAGTGCIGISILLERPMAKLVAVEKSADALEFLRRNISALKVSDRVRLLAIPVEDLNDNDNDNDFDLIVANPPYISPADPDVETNVRIFEPAAALFSDQEGYGAIKRWLDVAANALKPKGHLIMEVGAGQAGLLREHSVRGMKLETVRRDLAGQERVLIWRKT